MLGAGTCSFAPSLGVVETSAMNFRSAAIPPSVDLGISPPTPRRGYGKHRSAPVQGHRLPPPKGRRVDQSRIPARSSHGERRVSTASVGRHAPGLGQGRPLRPISGAKRRHDLSSEEPHLLQQQIRGFIPEQADVTKGQSEMLEAALSKSLRSCEPPGRDSSRDHVVAFAKGSDVTLEQSS